jgi:predicted nicotinamide N-methyase
LKDQPVASPLTVECRAPLETSDITIGERDWQITAVASPDALLDSAEDFEHFPFGLMLWESSIGLARHLAARPDVVVGRSVLELGAGVGFTGIVVRSMRAAVWQTDHQKGALQLAHHNAVQNGVTGIECFQADWRSWTHTGRYDILIGADITYERATHFYLEEIFDRNLAPSGAILLSDPGRPQSLEFAARLEDKGWHISMDTQPVALESSQASGPVEVTILTLTR